MAEDLMAERDDLMLAVVMCAKFRVAICSVTDGPR